MVGLIPVTPFWWYKEAVLCCGIHFLVYFLQKQEHNQHSVHRIRLLSCWQKLGEACQLSTWNAGFLLIHPLPSVSLPIVAHQSSHWDNDREVSWYTLMKCNILKDFCLCQTDRDSWLKIIPSKSRLINSRQGHFSLQRPNISFLNYFFKGKMTKQNILFSQCCMCVIWMKNMFDRILI